VRASPGALGRSCPKGGIELTVGRASVGIVDKLLAGDLLVHIKSAVARIREFDGQAVGPVGRQIEEDVAKLGAAGSVEIKRRVHAQVRLERIELRTCALKIIEVCLEGAAASAGKLLVGSLAGRRETERGNIGLNL